MRQWKADLDAAVEGYSCLVDDWLVQLQNLTRRFEIDVPHMTWAQHVGHCMLCEFEEMF